jgi:hypothetical protein
MAAAHSGLLIIRAWPEPGSAKALRASVRLTDDVAGGMGDEVTFADVDAVCATVQRWLVHLNGTWSSAN